MYRLVGVKTGAEPKVLIKENVGVAIITEIKNIDDTDINYVGNSDTRVLNVLYKNNKGIYYNKRVEGKNTRTYLDPEETKELQKFIDATDIVETLLVIRRVNGHLLFEVDLPDGADTEQLLEQEFRSRFKETFNRDKLFFMKGDRVK